MKIGKTPNRICTKELDYPELPEELSEIDCSYGNTFSNNSTFFIYDGDTFRKKCLPRIVNETIITQILATLQDSRNTTKSLILEHNISKKIYNNSETCKNINFS